MKRPRIFWILIACLIAWVGLNAYQLRTYPHTQYAYYQSDEVEFYLDRIGGYVWKRIPIWEPDNPAWVDFLRAGADWIIGITLFGLIIWQDDKFRKRRDEFEDKRNREMLQAIWLRASKELQCPPSSYNGKTVGEVLRRVERKTKLAESLCHHYELYRHQGMSPSKAFSALHLEELVFE